jgi:hypothetical protein
MSIAGSVVVTAQSEFTGARRRVSKYTLAWTSDASGNVSGTATDYISGAIVGVVFVPGTGGNQPSDAYDVTLVIFGGDGIDLLTGLGANLSQSSNTRKIPGLNVTDGTNNTVGLVAIDDQLELVVQNAGNAKSGQVILYVR